MDIQLWFVPTANPISHVLGHEGWTAFLGTSCHAFFSFVIGSGTGLVHFGGSHDTHDCAFRDFTERMVRWSGVVQWLEHHQADTHR